MLDVLGQSGLVGPVKNRDFVDKLNITGRVPGQIPFLAQGAPGQTAAHAAIRLGLNSTANLLELQDASGVAQIYGKISSSTGFVGARRFEFTDDASNRYLTSTLWQNNLGLNINAPTIGLQGGGDANQYWVVSSGGVFTGALFGSGNKNYTIRGFDQDGVGGRGVCSLTLKGGNASTSATSNQAGSQLILQGGLGTSQGAPGNVTLQGGALITASGTTLQSYLDRQIVGCSKVLANNTVTPLVNCTLASNTMFGGIIRYTMEVFDGTDLQVETGAVSFIETNKAGSFANNAVVKFGNQQACTAGTLVVTFTITAANPAVISVNANSSLTPSTGYPRITYTLENFTQQAVAVQ